MLTYPWKCTVLHCNHLGNTWKPLVLMTRHFDYCPSASEGDNQSVRSSAPVVSRCFPGGYNVKLYISRGRLAWWLLAFLCCVRVSTLQTTIVRHAMHQIAALWCHNVTPIASVCTKWPPQWLNIDYVNIIDWHRKVQGMLDMKHMLQCSCCMQDMCFSFTGISCMRLDTDLLDIHLWKLLSTLSYTSATTKMTVTAF